MPLMPAPGNSTSSPAITLVRPKIRAMPSPTESTWPVSATLDFGVEIRDLALQNFGDFGWADLHVRQLPLENN